MNQGRTYRLLYRFFSSFFSIHLTKEILYELLILKTKLSSKKTRRRFKGQRDMMINIGCGVSGKKGWTNVDAIYAPEVTCVWDCRKSLPFEDNSAQVIFTEHFVEHIDYYEEAPLLFKDIFRVLKPGGLFRIIVPDAQKYMVTYNQPGWEAIAKVRPLIEGNADFYTGQVMHTKMELVNEVFRQEYAHKYAYDFETLKRCLTIAGFKNIIHQDFNKSTRPEILIDNSLREPESLYIEATKE